ncbi:MAG TPA: dihydrolipoamide succinyltransferase [Myxococcales bacterium]|nr:dihydrolipoyllysine-residue succinyltransferase [Myxococcales bacterium]HAN30886.1 dihydrolipoamide succinyltransferase [Myxococcales bacterium]
MAGEIIVPTVGESITEVIVAEWLKSVGSWVEQDEPVVSLDTDKVSVEVPSPIAGFLREALKQSDDTANIGEVIGRVEAGERPAEQVPVEQAPVEQASAPEPSQDKAAAVVAMPAAARAAATEGVDLAGLKGSGKGGRILKEDVMQAAAAPAPAPAPTPAPRAAASPSAPVAARPAPTGGRQEEVVAMTRMRKKIAERLVQSQHTTASLTTFNEVDMSAIMALRGRFKQAYLDNYGIKLGFMSFFAKAIVDALKIVPELNAEIRGTDVVYRDYLDLGVAVGGGKGLVVPVVRNVERLSFAEIELAIADYGRRARDNKLKVEELTGGTFSVSNGGVYGSMMSTPILNPPQSGILGMHNIIERPIGVKGQIELRPMMYIALTYDHRIVDGKGAVTFLKRVKECCESPERMLLEI